MLPLAHPQRVLMTEELCYCSVLVVCVVVDRLGFEFLGMQIVLYIYKSCKCFVYVNVYVTEWV